MREPREMANGGWLSRIADMQDRKSYSEQHWEGSFEDYLEIVRKNPKITRTAFQRVYDMILSHGKTPGGAVYTFAWDIERMNLDGQRRREVMPCPMHEDPLHLIPQEWRERVYAELSPPESGYAVPDTGDLCPACRFVYKELMTEYKGDWERVMSHIRAHRLILSEKDRVGIGTFQPKDEKNQDSTELTGDINYRKIAEYGSDSDPRAFNFDGEF